MNENNTLNELQTLADKWQCANNEMVQIMIRQYADQEDTIATIKQAQKESEDNYERLSYAKELPKQYDAALRTAKMIQKLIMEYGKKPEVKVVTELSQFLDADDWDDDSD